MERLLLRPAEVAQTLGIGRTKVYELLATGEIPSIKIGNRPRVPVDALERWIQAQLDPEDTDNEPIVKVVPEHKGRRGGNRGER